MSMFWKETKKELHADGWASKYFTWQLFLARAVMPSSLIMSGIFGPMNTGVV
jgi:hypothetical protein